MALSDEYYDLLMPYVPKPAREVIRNQREIIDAKIDAKVDAFSEELKQSIEQEVEAFIREETKSTLAAIDSISAHIDELRENDRLTAEAIQAATQEFQRSVKAHRDKLVGIGKGVRNLAFQAASSAGLKLPYERIGNFMDGVGGDT